MCRMRIRLLNEKTVETACLLSKLHEAKHHVNVTLEMDELEHFGTGKILAFEGEELKSSKLTWEIESHDSWSSVHLYSNENEWNCNYEIEGEYLVELSLWKKF